MMQQAQMGHEAVNKTFHRFGIKSNADLGLVSSIAGSSGIANSWTIQLWIIPIKTNIGVDQYYYDSGTGNENRIFIYEGYANYPGKIGIRFYDSAADQIKWYVTSADVELGMPLCFCATWNGTSLLIYINGVQDSPIAAINNSGTMTTSSGQYFYLGQKNNYSGRTYAVYNSLAIWNTVLPANALAVTGASNYWKQDLRINNGNYTHSGNLEQYHVFGKGTDAPNVTDNYVLSKNYSLLANAIEFDNTSTGQSLSAKLATIIPFARAQTTLLAAGTMGSAVYTTGVADWVSPDNAKVSDNTYTTSSFGSGDYADGFISTEGWELASYYDASGDAVDWGKKVGQSFTCTNTCTLNRVQASLGVAAGSTGTVYMELWTHNGTWGNGVPGSLLATSNTIAASDIGTTPGLGPGFDFLGDERETLQAGVNYFIITCYSDYSSPTRWMTVRCKSSSGQAGNLAYWNGSDWISSPSYDAVFWVGVVRGKSQYLLATNFNFSIPTTASAITCFKITVEGKSSVITPKTTVFASVRMQRDAGVGVSLSTNIVSSSPALTASDATYTFTPTIEDLNAVSAFTITPSQANEALTGINIAFRGIDTVSIDQVKVQCTYIPATYLT